MRKIGVLVVVVVLAVIGLGVFQLVRTPPLQTVTVTGPPSLTVPGTAALPWPATGEAAVSIGTAGTVRTSGTQVPRPIASLAKIMTAYIVLKDHPITGGSTGPTITVTTADVATYQADAAASDSVLQVAAGEPLTEQQALEALLIPSADNVADFLAMWDAGSVSAFVVKMNSTAKSLGLTQTTYTDPSGVTTKTVSTAVDQLTISERAMENPDFARIVAMPAATFPIVGTVQNFDYDVGHTGVIGVKTGSESASGGCWSFAAKRTVAGATRTVYGVVLGIPVAATGYLEPSLSAGLALANAMPGTVHMFTAVPAGTTVGYVRAPWRSTPIPVVTTKAISGLFLNGTRPTSRVSLMAPRGVTVSKGAVLGSLRTASFLGVVHTPVVAGAAGSGPGLGWRLTRR